MEQNKIDVDKIEEEKRKRQLAIIKSSNEMLQQIEKAAIENTKDEVKKNTLRKQFNDARKENGLKAKNYLHASEDDVENATYREVDQEFVDKYKKRLEIRNLTDDDLNRMEVATITTSKTQKNEKKGKTKRRPRLGSKKVNGEEVETIANEEELMKQSLVTDERQIEEHIKRGKEMELKAGERLKEDLKKMKEIKKVRLEGTETQERVVVDNSEKVERIENKVQNQKEKKTKKKTEEVVSYDFDFSNIPSYVQYDVIPLPSEGRCYPIGNPLRCGRVPVAYLTASDENIITSPNVYRDGKILDIILERKILDKRIKVADLSSGDRDAIILWLRATSYGEEFPIKVTNPSTKKSYDITINLSQFGYLDFNLESDEEGLFTFKTNGGDEIKFKYFTAADEEKIKKQTFAEYTDSNKFEILRSMNFMTLAMGKLNIDENDLEMLNEDIEEIRQIIGLDSLVINEDTYPTILTAQMKLHTISINGNEDCDFISNYIENMRAKEALAYRNYISDNKPGVDFQFTVNIPESDGGGSFTAFLELDDTVFINV